MTPFTEVYNAFLVKMLDDEWANWTQEEILEDFRGLLEGAIPWFKFPRISLARNDIGFVEDLSSGEIQILACYVKCEWLNRTILTWENIKPLYEERDFSQANMLSKLIETLAFERKNVAKLEAIYYRSINEKPFNYGLLAGGN